MAENARLPSSPTPTSVALAHGDEHADWLAASRAGDIFVMKKLIASSCDAPALCRAQARGVSSAGHSAAHWLAAGGHVACLRWLLSQPSATDIVHITNNGRSTPLHSAAANGHAEAVSLLLSSGANPRATDESGDTAFDCAASRGHEAAARPLSSFAPPHAFLHLSVGGKRAGPSLIFRLLEDVAPRACANFLGLCEGFRRQSRVPGALYGRDGTMASATASTFYGYRSCTFHRLLHGQVLQGGRMSAVAGGDADVSIFGARFDDERAGLNAPQDRRGLLCMANSGPNSNASQFYITLAPCEHLSGGYVCFGTLVGDDAVLVAAESVPTLPNTHQPVVPIVITACGRWPPPARASADDARAKHGSGKRTEAVTSLSAVGAAAEESRSAVATAVAEALRAEAANSRKRSRDSEGPNAGVQIGILDDEQQQQQQRGEHRKLCSSRLAEEVPPPPPAPSGGGGSGRVAWNSLELFDQGEDMGEESGEE